MKKIKRLLTVFLLLFVVFGLAKVEAKDKVKVYIFEAGGCPYCEAQLEYLKGLKSYGKKFEIVEKELYVDHIDWKQGKDYALGKKVAEEFNKVGFTDASYQGTPFVVISDVYAISSYSESLESVIDEVYEKGDEDIVSCISKGNTDCLDHLKTEEAGTTSKSDNKVEVILLVVTIVLVSANIVLTILCFKKNNVETAIEHVSHSENTYHKNEEEKESVKPRKKQSKR
jgi:glutaredoxin